MRTVEKPWGFEKIWASTKDYVAKIIVINPEQRLSKQYHNTKEETVYVLEGVLLNFDENDDVHTYSPGEVFHVYPGQVHRFGAGPSSVRIVEVSTNHLDDVVRLEDDYGRKSE